MPTWLKISLTICAVLAMLFLLDRLGLWLESRGWIYYRKVKPRGGASPVLNALQQIVEPQIRHVIEEREQRSAVIEDKSASTGSEDH